MVNSSGVVKLVDFGIAKLLESFDVDGGSAETRAQSAPRTAQGQIVGTVAYMSPEQARGEPVDARSDLFSFGTLFYEMLTGHRPFQAGDSISTLAAILNSEPPPPSTVVGTSLPREVERVVLRCLRKDRDRRFQTASDLKLELEDLAEDTATTARGQQITTPRRRPWARIALGVAGVAVVAAIAMYAFRSRPLDSGRPRLRQLTFEAGVAITPALSRDGKLLAYASDRSGEPQLDIWLKQIAGGEPLRLTSGPDSKVNPQFSPDGTRVYYLGGRNEIFEVPALGGASRKVFENAGPFSVSARGDIAFYRPGTGTAPGPIFIVTAGSDTAG
ncbi:MAG: serine/threonine protein kinase, partial [Vicinamibacterales bacterium]